MRGLVLTSLKQFVTTTLGEPAWTQLLADAGLEGKLYLVSDTYPDEDVVGLVTAASTRTGIPAPDLVRKFGEFLVPGLVHTYRAFIKPSWRTLDFIAEVEDHIHKAVRLREPEAAPPRLRATRTTPTQVVVHYDSPRRLCPLAEGIVAGVAAHYGERVNITQTSCMVRGDPACVLVVDLVA
ncbi:MAG: heme NO-binding domain-containing protein [Gemmatimonadales bacterium]